MTDFFQKERTKKEQLLDFIRSRKEVKTHEIIAWGSSHFFNRADRTARELASEGKIRRMDEAEKNWRYLHIKEDVWVYIDKL